MINGASKRTPAANNKSLPLESDYRTAFISSPGEKAASLTSANIAPSFLPIPKSQFSRFEFSEKSGVVHWLYMASLPRLMPPIWMK